MLYIDKSALSKLEAGKLEISIGTCAQLAKIFHVSIEYLIWGEETPYDIVVKIRDLIRVVRVLLDALERFVKKND